MSACLPLTAELSGFVLPSALIHLYHSKESMKLIFYALSIQFHHQKTIQAFLNLTIPVTVKSKNLSKFNALTQQHLIDFDN